MPLFFLNQDITLMKTDAIVNAANPELTMGGGVCGAIFRAADPEKMSRACAPLAPIAVGGAVITPGFHLPARFVIHTAGPIYHRLRAIACRRQLRSCYLNSLALAETSGCRSIAFPLISSGIYGYPREEALQIAEESIRDFLQDHEMEVYLLVRDETTTDPELMRRIQEYLDSLLPDEAPSSAHLQSMRADFTASISAVRPETKPRAAKAPHVQKKADRIEREAALCAPVSGDLDSRISSLDESFSQTLLRLIDAKGRKDVEVYKRANLDRKLFSKIRTGKGYMPSKRTALALAVSLELDLKETEDLLGRAGYTLSHSQKFDVIVEYFILNRIYDLYLINETLFQYDQPLLGG